MTCPYRETRIDSCPPEPIAWDVCSARDSPGVTYACHAENCTFFGPWGAWRAVFAEVNETADALIWILRWWDRDERQYPDTLKNPAWYLDAVGWSP